MSNSGDARDAKGAGFAGSPRDLDEIATLFRLLSDKTRLMIVILLASGEKNVSALCAQLKLPQPTVSHHLSLLRMNNVVASRRQGREIFYGVHGHVTGGGAAAIQIALENYLVQIAPKGA